MSLVPIASRRATTQPRRSAASQNHQAYAFSAPIKGIDVTQPMPGGDPFTAIRMDNLIPRVLGCQLRRGYSRWLSHLGGEVRSLLQFHPANGAPKMFAAASTGDIFDATLAQPSTATPVPVVNVPNTTGRAGDWATVNFTTSAGVHVMVAVNAGGGMYVYDGATWDEVAEGTAVGEIEGVDPATFEFVIVYKNRLWFTVKDSTSCWYLPVGQYAGKATEFPFGAMLPNGGAVVGLVNWSFDGGGGSGGGAGMTNQLVVIADQGDILVYQGNDPDTAAEFQVVGRWYVGRVPAGNRFFSQYSTDVAILSERGIAFMSELMRGQGFFKNAENAQDINSELAKQVSSTLDQYYWEIRFLPHEQLLIINMPLYLGQERQWAFEVNNRAFCGLLGIPMYCVETFDGRSFCGDTLGNVWWVFEGNSDGKVDDIDGTDLMGTVVTAFSPLGEAIRTKRFLMLRASFISTSAPGVLAVLNSEWDLTYPSGAPPFIGAGENQWDVGQWNLAIWSSSGSSYEWWQGAQGFGRYGALAMQIRAAADTIFIGWQVVVEQGGIL